MSYFFTSESVSEGHPDKVADQISDSLLDEFLRRDPNSHVACETLVTTGLVVVSGEVTCDGYVEIQDTVRNVIRNIGYTKGEYMFEANSCGILSTIHGQSGDINQGVDRSTLEEQGAGDQGMMFGYTCSETPDNDNGKPQRIEAIVISTQHDDFDEESKMLARIKEDVRAILIPRVLNRLSDENRALFASEDYKLFVNPTGKFVIGGPHGDTGLTGRKIIVDTYGGRGAHGGGAFSGKDASKVDRSAAYATRHIAKNMVAAGVCDEVLVQVAYAIGVAEPVGLYVNTYGTSHVEMSDGEIAQKIGQLFDMRPYAIIERFGLKNPIYAPTAAYGHIGRDPYSAPVTLYDSEGNEYTMTVDFFAWEKLDYVEQIREAFGLK